MIFNGSGMGLIAQTDTIKKVKTTVLPVVGYSPETSWAFGLMTNFMFKSVDSSNYNRPSNIQPIFIASIKKQFIFFGKANIYFKRNYLIILQNY